MVEQRPNYTGDHETLVHHTCFKSTHGTARMANNVLELTLKKEDYPTDTSELTVYVYQYLMTDIQEI